MELEKRKVLFLDRDGTICYDEGAFGSEKLPYSEVLDKLSPIEGVKESLRLAKNMGYLLIIISNQAGICKGRFNEADTHTANKKLERLFDGMIDGFYYCPHHETGKNNKGLLDKDVRRNLICHCKCRKPEIGMFLECENDLKNGRLKYIDEDVIANNVGYVEDRTKLYKKSVDACLIDKENSYMIGDKWIDVMAGERYGVKPIFVMSGEGSVEYNKKKADVSKKYGWLPIKYTVYNDINEFIKGL